MREPVGQSIARERILHAAQRVASEQGSARVTLETVAQVAGVSKGGLLYHFPTKEALIAALAEDYVTKMGQCIEAARADLQATDNVALDLQARIVGLLCGESRASGRSLGAVLFLAAAMDPASLGVIRQRLAEESESISASSPDFARVMTVRLAIDGLIMRESLHISSLTEAQREQVVAELMRLASHVHSV